MPNITLTFNNVPQAAIDDLSAIALEAGYPNFRAMLLAYLRAELQAYRSNKALKGIRETAEAQAAQELAGIS